MSTNWNEKIKSMEGWHFGGKGSGFEDKLLDLVVRGIKTATCSWFELYELEGEEVEKVGDQSYIMNSSDTPVCVIETTEIEIKKFSEVDEDFARAEGEGDLSYEYWRRVHEEFFTKSSLEHNLEWNSDTQSVVCERFKVVHIF